VAGDGGLNASDSRPRKGGAAPMVVLKGIGEGIDISFERVKRDWVRFTLSTNDAEYFLGAERPKYLLGKMNEYCSSWPEEMTCVLVFSETHNCLYGKRKNAEESEILFQDQEAKVIFRWVIKKDDLLIKMKIIAEEMDKANPN
jgi:hypothetical protein